MSIRKIRKLAVLAKIEATPGTDAVPTAAANGIQFKNVTFTPMDGEEVPRDLILPYLGNQGVDLSGFYGKIEAEIEMAGSGTAGTPPAWGVIARACGRAEVITAGSKVEYFPISDGEESVSIYWNQDGVRHVLLYAKGNLGGMLPAKKSPTFKVSLVGLLGTISDVALPAPVLTAFKRPVLVTKANTSISIHGVSSTASPLESFTFDDGTKVEPRFLIGAESVEITERSSTATAIVEAKPLATVDWFSKAKARDRGEVVVTHGTVAGNIIEMKGPAVEIGKPSQGQTQGILNYTLPLALCPNAGNDEWVITVK